MPTAGPNASEPAVPAAPAPAASPTLARPPVRPRLLVVDDEQPVRGFLAEALSGRAYDVDTAAGGREAIEKTRTGRYDLLLCDLKMPDVDGLQVIGAIRKEQPDLPIIVISGHGTMADAVEALRRGVFDFLQKPLVLDDVLFSVARALERRDLVERVGLYDLSRDIFETLDPDDLYNRVARSAIQVLRADDVSLMVLDERRELVIAMSTSLADDIQEETRLAMGERIAGRVALQTEPIVINDDVARDERFAGVRPLRPIRAAIVCPLTMRGRLLGVLNVSRVAIAEPYSERDRRNAMILGSLVALALGNARLHKELETRLQQLHAAQEEVIQNEKMTALGGLLSGVAHELNNPLCSVLGYAQLLAGAEVDPRTRKGIDVILRETERANRIVANLLRFARRERPEVRPLGLNAVLRKVLERKSADLKICRIEVRADLDPGLPAVLGDFHHLMTAFGNLVANAQEAMFEASGRGTLTVTTGARGGLVTVAFSDDGPGIAAEHLRRVFDPFFTTKTVGAGTGLGLSVAFAIVRDHGGTLRVAPGRGRGATFVVELPIPTAEALEEAGDRPGEPEPRPAAAAPGADAGAAGRPAADAGAAGRPAADGPAERPAPPAPSASRRPRGRRKSRASAAAAGRQTDSGVPRILVAEPDPRVADLLIEVLGTMGFAADIAPDRDAVLARLAGGEYQALIADHTLPNLDGRLLLEALRARQPALARRVIFLAGDPGDARLMAFVSSSGNMLVGKPFDPVALRAAVRRLVVTTLIDDAPVH